MPILPLQGPTPLAGGALPVRSVADVLAVFPAEVRRSTNAKVRDALVAALTAIMLEYQRRSSRSAALADILRSVGPQLDGLARDRGVFRQPGEIDTSLQARLISSLDLVTPVAILAGVDAILAPYTTKRSKYFESELDCLFVHDGGEHAWDSFVFDGQSATSPRYPDRLYPDDAAANGGDAIAQREVLGAWVFSDTRGRHFVLRIPPLESADADGAFALNDEGGMFVGDGTDADGAESDGSVATFVSANQGLATELYAAICAAVEGLKGQGMRWTAYVDPLL